MILFLFGSAHAWATPLKDQPTNHLKPEIGDLRPILQPAPEDASNLTTTPSPSAMEPDEDADEHLGHGDVSEEDPVDILDRDK